MIDRNLMFASDNAVRDALTKQRKLTNSDLKSLFISRGILVSKETKREDLALYFSRLNHDYYDHQSIANVMGVTHRKEKSSVTYINAKFSKDEIENALYVVHGDQQQEGDNREVLVRENGFELRIDYQQIDYGKSEFCQVVNKDAVVSISETDEGISIRWPLNDYVEKIKDRLLDVMARQRDDDDNNNFEVEEIELSNIIEPKLRTNFFIRLIDLIDGYERNDVSDVYVYNPKKNDADVDEEGDIDDDSNLGTHITKVSLSGEGVQVSQELKSLYDKGFYTCKVVWTAKKKEIDSDLYQFEAQFSNPEECKAFSYMVSGVYKFKSLNKYNKSKHRVDTIEEQRFSKLIEQAAKKALIEIQNAFKKGVYNDSE